MPRLPKDSQLIWLRVTNEELAAGPVFVKDLDEFCVCCGEFLTVRFTQAVVKSKQRRGPSSGFALPAPSMLVVSATYPYGMPAHRAVLFDPPAIDLHGRSLKFCICLTHDPSYIPPVVVELEPEPVGEHWAKDLGDLL